MASKKRNLNQILDGGPLYLSNYPFDSLKGDLVATNDLVVAAFVPLGAELKAAEKETICSLSDAKIHILEIRRRKLRSVANTLTTVQILLERIYDEQSYIVSVDSLKPDPFIDFDGSAEHKLINKKHSATADCISADTLSMYFFCNDIILCLANVLFTSSKRPVSRSFDPENLALELCCLKQDVSDSSLLHSIIDDFFWLEAHVLLPCGILHHTGWQIYVCGYDATLKILGHSVLTKGQIKHSVFFRRCFSNCKTYYEGARFLTEEYGKFENLAQRKKLLKAIKTFGMASVNTYEILEKICQVTKKLLEYLAESESMAN